MPELPDLVHIVSELEPEIRGRTIREVRVDQPIVLRVMELGDFREILAGQSFGSLKRHGPFLEFFLDRNDLVMHLMLAGRLRLSEAGQKAIAKRCFAFLLDDGRTLEYADDKLMGKIYLVPRGKREGIPLFSSQGFDITRPDFTWEVFSELIAKKRVQARVFLMDQSVLSAIGNAYADEILFDSRIHPKTPCYALDETERRRLFTSIGTVIAWGIEEVHAAGAALEQKVRGHMKVRNRKDQACVVCGTLIRREQVHGYDTFYCPHCQKDKTGKSLPWERLT